MRDDKGKVVVMLMGCVFAVLMFALYVGGIAFVLYLLYQVVQWLIQK